MFLRSRLWRVVVIAAALALPCTDAGGRKLQSLSAPPQDWLFAVLGSLLMRLVNALNFVSNLPPIPASLGSFFTFFCTPGSPTPSLINSPACLSLQRVVNITSALPAPPMCARVRLRA